MLGARLRRSVTSTLVTTVLIIGHQVVLPSAAIAGTWTVQTSGTTVDLKGVSCPTIYVCWASGGNGTILNTVDGGATWTTQRSGGFTVYDISCPTTTTCWAAALTTC